MNWDEVIEKVAFGQTAPKLSSVLGMFLSPETIYIAQARLDKAGKLAVDHLVRIPVPVPEDKAKGAGPATGTGTLNTSFLTENQKLGSLVQQSMSQYRWDSKHVMVTLSHHLGLLRYFTMPAIERRFWKSAVPVEAKKYIPIPFDVLSSDYQCIPLPPDANNRPRQGTLIAVTQKQNLTNIATMLQGLGLSIAGMEVAPCSVLKLWQALNPAAASAPYCQVHFDGGNVRILVADKGFPVFFREVFLGDEANIADQRKLDLGGCITFAQKQLSVGAVSQVSISGSAATLPAWKDAFSRELGLPVAVQETASMLGIKSGDWGGYAAIGSSLRFQVHSAMSLDLGAVGRVTDEERSVARDILIAGGALTLLLLTLGLYKMGIYEMRAREFKTLKRDADIEAVFSSKTSSLIEEMFKKMRQQADLTSGICGPTRVRMTDLFKDIVESLPEKAWLTKISVSRPLGKEGSAVMTLNGHAVAEDTAREQDLGFQFRDRLSKTPVVGKVFKGIQVTVQAETNIMAPTSGGSAMTPEQFAKKQEERTSFSVTGTAKVR